MEYMLLKDGSVRSYADELLYDGVMRELRDNDGVGYYWPYIYGAWGCLRLGSENADNVPRSDVPPQILLAQMLE